jgi:CRP/FNR family transcriptional regulator, nitrogen fixation regulation protein
MLTQVAHAIPLPRKPDIALPLRGRRTDHPSGLNALGVVMNFARNMEIYAEGEPAGNVYKVVSGVVRISKLLPDGRRQISAFHTAGDMFGFEADDLHHASAEAVTPVKVIAYKWQSLLADSAGSASVVRDLLNLTIIGLRQTQEHLLLLGRKNALERVAAFLLDMAKRTKTGPVVELAMARHDIADYLGLTLETVSRMFAELKDQGAIKLEGARRVHLLDTERLVAMSA